MDLTPPPPPDPADENIVSFRDGKPLADGGAFPLTMTERPGYCAGWCRRVFVCEKRRMLQCQDCGTMIEPYDYIAQWARTGDSRLGTLKDLKVQIANRSAELARLKMDIQNAKSQLRRATETA